MRVREILSLVPIVFIFSCGARFTGTGLDKIIDVSINSKEEIGALIFWRIEFMVVEVSSTNMFLLGRTPYRETRSIYLPVLSKSNIGLVYAVIELKKEGYYAVIERFNLKGLLNERRLSVYNLYKKYKKTEGALSTIKNDIVDKLKGRPPEASKKLLGIDKSGKEKEAVKKRVFERKRS